MHFDTVPKSFSVPGLTTSATPPSPKKTTMRSNNAPSPKYSGGANRAPSENPGVASGSSFHRVLACHWTSIMAFPRERAQPTGWPRPLDVAARCSFAHPSAYGLDSARGLGLLPESTLPGACCPRFPSPRHLKPARIWLQSAHSALDGGRRTAPFAVNGARFRPRNSHRFAWHTGDPP